MYTPLYHSNVGIQENRETGNKDIGPRIGIKRKTVNDVHPELAKHARHMLGEEGVLESRGWFPREPNRVILAPLPFRNPEADESNPSHTPSSPSTVTPPTQPVPDSIGSSVPPPQAPLEFIGGESNPSETERVASRRISTLDDPEAQFEFGDDDDEAYMYSDS